MAGLRERFRGHPLQFLPWRELADFYNKTVKLFSRQVAVLRLIIAVIIVLSISNSMMMSVLERTGEIGTAMALGHAPPGNPGPIPRRGALLGVAGGLLGLVVGFLAAQRDFGHRNSDAAAARAWPSATPRKSW